MNALLCSLHRRAHGLMCALQVNQASVNQAVDRHSKLGKQLSWNLSQPRQFRPLDFSTQQGNSLFTTRLIAVWAESVMALCKYYQRSDPSGPPEHGKDRIVCSLRYFCMYTFPYIILYSQPSKFISNDLRKTPKHCKMQFLNLTRFFSA